MYISCKYNRRLIFNNAVIRQLTGRGIESQQQHVVTASYET